MYNILLSAGKLLQLSFVVYLAMPPSSKYSFLEIFSSPHFIYQDRQRFMAKS